MESKQKEEEQLEMLADIRNLMDRSSRFISLSGLSGVVAGCSALLGVVVVLWQLNQNQSTWLWDIDLQHKPLLLVVAFGVLLLALLGGVLLTIKEAKKQGQPIWDKTSRRLLSSLFIPLMVGGLFCLILANRGDAALILPSTLIFYGLGLVSASKYTLEDIKYLGYAELFWGLLAAIIVGYGLVFWAIGFGLMHIVYGIYMHLKYNK